MKPIGECNDNVYFHALSTCFTVTREAHIKLLKEFGSAKAFYEAPAAWLKEYLQPREIRLLEELREKTDVGVFYGELERKGIRHVGYGQKGYPEKLLEIPGAPLSLYYIGDLPAPEEPAVSIIGARVCSSYGKHTAELFAERLAANGVSVISGMAMGIDGIAQSAAVRVGGKSYGVLGCGVDVIYPQSNRRLYDALIGGSGGVLSEYPPGTAAQPAYFPPRNRIISALSDILLVVEAREKSGTMITVDMALEQGREIYAIPGRIVDELSAGCHRLIRQGAGLASSPADLLEELSKKRPLPAVDTGESKNSFGDASSVKAPVPPGLTPEEKILWSYLSEDPKETEEIFAEMAKMGDHPMEIRELMVHLMGLYARGFLTREEGGFRKKT
ncbi:MAG: DNA-processing protein DprA [Lachnospiraceae bacterium]|nr:DNA-processing protein DprA [Lachnospiraceae bacterium]